MLFRSGCRRPPAAAPPVRRGGPPLRWRGFRGARLPPPFARPPEQTPDLKVAHFVRQQTPQDLTNKCSGFPPSFPHFLLVYPTGRFAKSHKLDGEKGRKRAHGLNNTFVLFNRRRDWLSYLEYGKVDIERGKNPPAPKTETAVKLPPPTTHGRRRPEKQAMPLKVVPLMGWTLKGAKNPPAPKTETAVKLPPPTTHGRRRPEKQAMPG